MKPTLISVADFIIMCVTSVYVDIRIGIADGLFIVFLFCLLFLFRYIGQHWELKSEQLQDEKTEVPQAGYADGTHSFIDPVSNDEISYEIEDGVVISVEVKNYRSPYFK